MITTIRLPENIKSKINTFLPSIPTFSEKLRSLIDLGCQEIEDARDKIAHNETPNIRVIAQKYDYGEVLSPLELGYLLDGVYSAYERYYNQCLPHTRYIYDLLDAAIILITDLSLSQQKERDIKRHLSWSQEIPGVENSESLLSTFEIISQYIKEEIINNNLNSYYLKSISYILTSLREEEGLIITPSTYKALSPYLKTLIINAKFAYRKRKNEAPFHYVDEKIFYKENNIDDADYRSTYNNKYAYVIQLRDKPYCHIEFLERKFSVTFNFDGLEDLLKHAYSINIDHLTEKVEEFKGIEVDILMNKRDDFYWLKYGVMSVYMKREDFPDFLEGIKEVEKNIKPQLENIRYQMGSF
ncbi:hypothetical protein IM40_10110 (plasmid) [Candidatus Paracaedimonas acanthamoebae]|nr:hypothetical protein IM40_10110 [Candidatus Paracaedimonas acanthamoebae]